MINQYRQYWPSTTKHLTVPPYTDPVPSAQYHNLPTMYQYQAKNYTKKGDKQKQMKKKLWEKSQDYKALQCIVCLELSGSARKVLNNCEDFLLTGLE